MPLEYALEDSLTERVKRLLEDESYIEFAPIRSNDIQFLTALMVKTDKQEVEQPTSGPPIVVRRIGPADAVFLEGFHFKLYFCSYRWNQADENTQRAMLHHALCRVSVELKEKGLKLALNRPDVESFQANVARFGAWEQPLLELRENLARALKEKARGARE